MKRIKIFLFLVLISSLFISGKKNAGIHILPKEEDTFYIWNRSWNERVNEAVNNENPGNRFYILCAEYNKHSFPVNINWRLLAKQHADVIPVFRIHQRTNWLEKDKEQLKFQQWILNQFTRIKSESAKQKLKIRELQLDIDCPERLLNHYYNFLKGLKPKLKKTRLSITCLPCHLQNMKFHPIADLVNYYVLQVHGLEYPKTIDDDVALLRFKTAITALQNADKLKKEFKLALPCYAYQLYFNKNGQFETLTAENQLSMHKFQTRYIFADPADIIKIRQQVLKQTYCRGLLWFRLPVPGDRCCWDRNTIQSMQDGNMPTISINTKWKKKGKELTELYLVNNGVIGSGSVTLNLQWQKQQTGQFGISPDHKRIDSTLIPGIVPEKISCQTPTPGQERIIAWFRDLQETPYIKVMHNVKK